MAKKELFSFNHNLCKRCLYKNWKKVPKNFRKGAMEMVDKLKEDLPPIPKWKLQNWNCR